MNRRGNRDSLTRHILPLKPRFQRQFLPYPARIAGLNGQHRNMVNGGGAVFRHLPAAR
jgi:hypothetical protein